MPHARNANLPPNPDFEVASPTDPHKPAGWIIDESAPSTLRRTGRAPRTGRWALDARLTGGSATTGTIQLITESPVAVAPGARLLVGGCFLREPVIGPSNAPGHADDAGVSVLIAGRWLSTARGNATVGHFMTFPGEGLPIGSYEARSDAVVAPQDADALVLVCLLEGGDAETGRVAPLTIDSMLLRYAGNTDHAWETITRHGPGRDRDRHTPTLTPLIPSFG